MHTGMLYAADNIQQALLGVLRRVTSRGRLLKRSCTQDVVFSRLIEVCLASCALWFDGEVSSTGVPPRLSAISVHASLCTQVLDAEVSGTAVPPRSSAKDWPRRCVPERLCLGVRFQVPLHLLESLHFPLLSSSERRCVRERLLLGHRVRRCQLVSRQWRANAAEHPGV